MPLWGQAPLRLSYRSRRYQWSILRDQGKSKGEIKEEWFRQRKRRSMDKEKRRGRSGGSEWERWRKRWRMRYNQRRKWHT